MNAEYLSQVGLGIVAAAFGWWAWHLWTKLNTERTEHAKALKEIRESHASTIKDLNNVHLDKMSELTDKLINWSDIVRTALDQNTDALKGLRDGFRIYESLEEMRDFVRQQGRSIPTK